MKKIFYEKVGRRYKPVAEYDSEYLDSFPKGTHLVMCYPGGQSRRFNIDPNHAAMIAAGQYATDAISKVIVKASDMRPHKCPLTQDQLIAWDNLSKAFGEELHLLQWPSAQEAAEAGVKAMVVEAEKMLEIPVVRKAYEHFMLIYKLTKEENESKS